MPKRMGSIERRRLAEVPSSCASSNLGKQENTGDENYTIHERHELFTQKFQRDVTSNPYSGQHGQCK